MSSCNAASTTLPQDPTPVVYEHGPSTSDQPPIAIVGGTHGCEPCGPEAIRQIRNADHTYNRPVKFVIANEAAIERNQRAIDIDLNRAFPGDPQATDYERKLAANIRRELQDCEVLSLHSGQTSDPFVITQDITPTTTRLARDTGVDRIVNMNTQVSGTLEEYLNGVAVECGPKRTYAAVRNATAITEHFLAARGALDKTTTAPDMEFYQVYDTVVHHGSYEFVAENFARLDAGEVYAREASLGTEADQTTQPQGNGPLKKTAEESFYPVLMSSNCVTRLEGLKAEYVGPLDTDSGVTASHTAAAPAD